MNLFDIKRAKIRFNLRAPTRRKCFLPEQMITLLEVIAHLLLSGPDY
jgi:hypothetical protein